MENKPFIFGVATSGDNFTDREKETGRLLLNFQHGVNTVLISPVVGARLRWCRMNGWKIPARFVCKCKYCEKSINQKGTYRGRETTSCHSRSGNESMAKKGIRNIIWIFMPYSST